jgi:hypothetical protein
VQSKIVGFALADLLKHNIWALFVLPDFEYWGIGRKWHAIMPAWYFSRTREGYGWAQLLIPGGNFLQKCRLD